MRKIDYEERKSLWLNFKDCGQGTKAGRARQNESSSKLYKKDDKRKLYPIKAQ